MTEERAIKILNPDADVVWKAYGRKRATYFSYGKE